MQRIGPLSGGARDRGRPTGLVKDQLSYDPRARGEWISAGIFAELAKIARESYDRIVGLVLEELAVDGCITKAPSGGAGGTQPTRTADPAARTAEPPTGAAWPARAPQ